MILPLVSGGLRGCRGRFAGALLAIAVAVAPGPSVRAQAPNSPQAQGADPYSDTVTVDATAATAVKARDKARLDGQRRAFAAIFDRLAGGAGNARPPKLDDNQITDMVVNFEVANERMSPVRYIADYTYHFRAEDVQKLLKSAGIAVPDLAAAEPGKPSLLLPVYQAGAKPVLWDDPNPWRSAWAARKPAAGPSRFTLPLGDVSDVSTIDADKAVAGDAASLAAIGKKDGSDSVLVGLAVARGPADKPDGLDIALRQYRAGQLGEVHTLSLDANPGENPADLLRRAAEATEAAIASGWKGAPGQYDKQGSLTVAAAIGGLDDWVRLRDRLGTVPAIRKIDLRSLSRQEAVIEIGYLGSTDQLVASVAALGLQLSPGDPMWHLAASGAAASR